MCHGKIARADFREICGLCIQVSMSLPRWISTMSMGWQREGGRETLHFYTRLKKQRWHTHSLSDTHTHARTHAHTHAHTHTQTHTHAHTHAHTYIYGGAEREYRDSPLLQVLNKTEATLVFVCACVCVCIYICIYLSVCVWICVFACGGKRLFTCAGPERNRGD